MESRQSDRRPWLRSPSWDAFWLLSGLWLLVPGLAYGSFPEAMRAGFVVATLLLWLSHRFATAYTAYCTPGFKELLARDRRRFVLGPLVVFGSVFTLLFLPGSWVTLSLRERLLLLGTAFFVYNAYHFSVQHFGVLTIYRHLQGAAEKPTRARRRRRLDKTYCLVVTGVGVSAAQILNGAAIVDDTVVAAALSALPLSRWLEAVRPAAVMAIAAMTWVVARGETSLDVERRIVTPRRLYLASIAAQGIAAFYLAPLAFLLVWAVQHWLVSVALSAHMAENTKAVEPSTSLWYRSWAPLHGHFWPSVVLLSIISVLWTPLFELALHPERMALVPAWTEAFVPLGLLASPLAVKVVAALAFGSVFTHFVLDRAVFRLSDPHVRRVTGPLLFGTPAT